MVVAAAAYLSYSLYENYTSRLQWQDLMCQEFSYLIALCAYKIAFSEQVF